MCGRFYALRIDHFVGFTEMVDAMITRAGRLSKSAVLLLKTAFLPDDQPKTTEVVDCGPECVLFPDKVPFYASGTRFFGGPETLNQTPAEKVPFFILRACKRTIAPLVSSAHKSAPRVRKTPVRGP